MDTRFDGSWYIVGLFIVPYNNHDSGTPSDGKGKIAEVAELREKKRKMEAGTAQENAQVLLYQAIGTLGYIAAEFHQAQVQRMVGQPYESESGNLYELLEEILDISKQLTDLSALAKGVSSGSMAFLEAQIEELCESIARRSSSNPDWMVYNPEVFQRVHAIARHFMCIAIAQIPAENLDLEFEPPQI